MSLDDAFANFEIDEPEQKVGRIEAGSRALLDTLKFNTFASL